MPAPVLHLPARAENAPVTELVIPAPAPSEVHERAPATTPTAVPEPDMMTTWRQLVDRVQKGIAAGRFDARPSRVPKVVTRDRVVIGVEDDSFEETRSEQIDAKAVLTAAARAHFGKQTEVVVEQAARGQKMVASVAYLDAAKRKQAQVEARQAVESHPLVMHALKVFGAELKDVKLPPQDD